MDLYIIKLTEEYIKGKEYFIISEHPPSAKFLNEKPIVVYKIQAEKIGE